MPSYDETDFEDRTIRGPTQRDNVKRRGHRLQRPRPQPGDEDWTKVGRWTSARRGTFQASDVARETGVSPQRVGQILKGMSYPESQRVRTTPKTFYGRG